MDKPRIIKISNITSNVTMPTGNAKMAVQERINEPVLSLRKKNTARNTGGGKPRPGSESGSASSQDITSTEFDAWCKQKVDQPMVLKFMKDMKDGGVIHKGMSQMNVRVRIDDFVKLSKIRIGKLTIVALANTIKGFSAISMQQLQLIACLKKQWVVLLTSDKYFIARKDNGRASIGTTSLNSMILIILAESGRAGKILDWIDDKEHSVPESIEITEAIDIPSEFRSEFNQLTNHELVGGVANCDSPIHDGKVTLADMVKGCFECFEQTKIKDLESSAAEKKEVSQLMKAKEEIEESVSSDDGGESDDSNSDMSDEEDGESEDELSAFEVAMEKKMSKMINAFSGLTDAMNVLQKKNAQLEKMVAESAGDVASANNRVEMLTKRVKDEVDKRRKLEKEIEKKDGELAELAKSVKGNAEDIEKLKQQAEESESHASAIERQDRMIEHQFSQVDDKFNDLAKYVTKRTDNCGGNGIEVIRLIQESEDFRKRLFDLELEAKKPKIDWFEAGVSQEASESVEPKEEEINESDIIEVNKDKRDEKESVSDVVKEESEMEVKADEVDGDVEQKGESDDTMNLDESEKKAKPSKEVKRDEKGEKGKKDKKGKNKNGSKKKQRTSNGDDEVLDKVLQLTGEINNNEES